MKSWTQPTNEMIDQVLASVKKETDRQYFFSKLNNPLWVEPLRERGYFNNPPAVKQLPNGYVQYPRWPELSYLVGIAGEAPDQVIRIILSLPETDNPRVYEDILAIALKFEGKNSAELLPKIIEYIELDNPFLAQRYPELLRYWTDQGNITEALEITKILVPFQEDPRAREKQQLRKKKPSSSGTLLEPYPRFGQWEYQQILEKGVRHLAEHEPYQVSRILIDAVESMVLLGTHPENFEKGSNQDYSEIWCPRLDKHDRDFQDVKENLVQTLTYACEQVYENAQESIGSLDQALRNRRWQVFERLRQHLYASYPNDQILPWIREEILDHNDYFKWEYNYEFQLMVRKASELFGSRLLSEDECKTVFDDILSGPSKEGFRERMGEQYSEKAFQKRQRYFHLRQLRPFAALLSRDIRSYFDELEEEAQEDTVTDDSYLPFKMESGGFVTYQSPKSAEVLESFTNDELLTYINDWDEEYRDKDNWLVEINISALASVFQSLFKEKIVPDGERLAFWMAERGRIARPVYVSAMLKAMLELIKEEKFDNIDQWIEFCEWVLSHQDTARVEGQTVPQDESRDHPDWGSSRRAVVDFIDACVNKDTGTPIAARHDLAALLRQACCQFDWRLDCNHPVLLSRDDPITEAMNNTRSRALDSLVNFGFWIRRQLPEDQLPEVADILVKRIDNDAEFPITRPERALLGMHFGNLCTLNRDWFSQQQQIFFPQKNQAVWLDAFGSYIRFNRPIKQTFEVLRGEFEYAIENLDILVIQEDDGKELIDRLGQHLFTYYLWEFYPLTGEKSLLELFYDKTQDDRKRWGRLFDHVGRSLSKSGRQLDKVLIDRILAFFDWRFETSQPLELQEFTFWLMSECLNAEWRLQSYSKILDLPSEKDDGLFLQVAALNKLLPIYPALVVECFAKITDTMDQRAQIHISASEAKPILKAGLNAEDTQTHENAERARENLLKFGHFEYLDIG